MRANVVVGETLEQARRALGKLDESFFTRLLEVSRERQTVYLTVGHGERNEHPDPSSPAPSGLNRFQALLRARNFIVKPLGPAEGLGGGVPADAGLVVAAGPREPFLPGEGEALRRYLEGGGALLAFLEPSRDQGRRAGGRAPAGTTLAQELERYGIGFDPTVQANDRIYGRRTFTQADHALLVTVRYLNHPSVEGLRRAGNQFPLLLLEAGALRTGPAPAGLQAVQTVQAMPGTWGDGNGNFVFDAAETRAEPALAVAVGPSSARGAPGAKQDEPGQGPRILAFADADLAGDLLLQNRANQLAVEEALAWLVKRPPLPELPASEEDVRLVHARADDWLWFYLPVLGIPALVIGFGWLRVRRLRSRPGGRHD
jgi:hypothetical protein